MAQKNGRDKNEQAMLKKMRRDNNPKMKPDLLSKILSAHPELNDVEKELVKSLVKILKHLEEADVDLQYLKFLSEGRLLAASLGLVKKQGGFSKSSDLGALLQEVGASKDGASKRGASKPKGTPKKRQLKTSTGFVDL